MLILKLNGLGETLVLPFLSGRYASPEALGQCSLHFISVFTIKQGADRIDKEDTTQELPGQQPPNSLGDAKSSRV